MYSTMMSPYRSYTLGTNPPLVYLPLAVMVVPVSRHEVGRSIKEDGPLLPSAFIWRSDSTEIGICPPGEAVVVGVGIDGAGAGANSPA